jgi:sugar lactone lactonase YvrE
MRYALDVSRVALVMMLATGCSVLTSFDGFDSNASQGRVPLPVCSATQLDCDGDPANGCETDVDRSPLHCGACQHGCLRGACEAGRCQPFELASGQAQPLRIVIDATHVYWVNQGAPGAVMRRRLDDGAPETVWSVAKIPGGIALDADAIYWSQLENGGSVFRLAKAQVGTSAAPQELATGQGGSIGVAVDATHVYWTTPGTVRRVPKQGGALQTLARDQELPFSLLVDVGRLFWTNYQGGQVMTVLLSNPVPTPVATRQGAPAGLAGDLAALYWTNNQPGAGGEPPAVMTIEKVNAGAPTILADRQQAPVGVTVFGNDVFWTNSEGGTVLRVPKQGGTPVVLASGQATPAEVAVDASAVYWVNRDDGRVMAVAR